jgi:uncharacterized protein
VKRFTAQLRAEVMGNTLTGHAAVFGQYADVGPNLEELAPGAFDQVLKDPATDVRALFNHDPNLVLGRQSAGTLKLGTDSQGLEFAIDLPNTSVGNDLRELMARGDVDGASFMFMPGEDTWSRSSDGRSIQTHTSIKRLVDVSPVTYPAYDGASVMLRSVVFGVGNRRASQLIRARHAARYGRTVR